MKKYFVHYTHASKSHIFPKISGVGMIQMSFSKGMDVYETKRFIEALPENTGQSVIITNFIELKKHECMGEAQ